MTQEKKCKKLNFGERFLDLLASSGKTQKEIAEIVRVSEGTIVNWKRGEILPKSEELLSLSRLFGVSMEWLLTGESEDQNAGAPDQWKQRAIEAETKVDILRSGMQGLLKKI